MKPAKLAHPFFAGLSPEQTELLLRGAREQKFAPGEIILREGEPASRFYLIQSGRVALESLGEQQDIIPIHEVCGGDVLGWSWLFPPYAWHFQARTLEPTIALVCDGADILVACEENHHVGHELMKRIAQLLIRRLHSTRRQLAQVRSLLNAQAVGPAPVTETATAGPVAEPTSGAVAPRESHLQSQAS